MFEISRCLPDRFGAALRPIRVRRWFVVLCVGFVVPLVTVSRVAAQQAGEVHFVREWGSEGTEPGEFHFPIGIAISSKDEVYVTDHYNNRVQKFDSNGKLLAQFAVLPNPGGIAIDASGNCYVSHFPASRLSAGPTPDRISVYGLDGKLIHEWGSSGQDDGQLNWPGGIAISKTQRVYVADQTNRRVQIFDAAGKFLGKWGEYGIKPGQFGGNVTEKSRVGGPQFIAIDGDGNVWTTEASVGRVQKFTADGQFLLAWGDNEDKPGSFGRRFQGTNLQGPIGICVAKRGGIWVSSAGGRIQHFTDTGKLLRGFGETAGSEPGEFMAPHGIAIDSRDQLYVVDAYNHRIQKFDATEPPSQNGCE